MDLVECEAPLDNSFQKDRRELVNKGSLGRRRKPSRSNLRLILSPSNDRQIIDVFHNHQQLDSDGSFIQEKASPIKILRESTLDNHSKSVSINQLEKEIACNNIYSDKRTASDNYRDVVGSIKKIYSNNCFDLNGNNQRTVSSLCNRENFSSAEQKEKSRNNQQNFHSESKNKVNSKYHSRFSVTRSHQNGITRDPQEIIKLSNGHLPSKLNHFISNGESQSEEISECNHYAKLSNGYLPDKYNYYGDSINPKISEDKNHCIIVSNGHFPNKSDYYKDDSRNQRQSEHKNHQESINSSKLQQTSKIHQNVITFSNHRQIVTSFPVQVTKSALANGNNYTTSSQDCSSKSYIDVRPDDTMLYRVPEDRHRRIHAASDTNGEITINGNSNVQEPEWISLSRKLCAKFVEGHIEPNSPDSYPYEEPEGVGEDVISSLPSKKSHSGSTSTIFITETLKKKNTPATSPSEEAVTNDEPPWIHLSRKLCNKFIEEHIEYPPITNGHFVEVPELVEPNGDVRIVEKIGKPKGHKSKQKKECEPEWVSLSKKLRAKFIESHIDDPNTIALDNQLNASDPDETGSETLSDVSQDTAIPKEISSRLTPVECKNYIVKDRVIEDQSDFEKNDAHPKDLNNEENNENAIFPEKECCWEYQEMEFDQESNSGNFQEYDEQPVEEIGIQYAPFSSREHSNKSEERVTFSNSFFSRNFECFNNDVKFMPYPENDEAVSNSPEQNKLITVQFIAHTKNDQQDDFGEKATVPSNTKSAKNGSFFNFSSWEVANFQDEEVDDLKKIEEIPTHRDFISKSLDNLCDSLEESNLAHESKRMPESSVDNFDLEGKNSSISEKLEDKEAKENFVNEMKMNYISCDIPFKDRNNSCNCTCENKEGKSEDNIPSHSNLFLQKEKEIFYDKKEIESSSEDEVFECASRKAEKYSSSFESNRSKEISSPESLKKDMQSNQSRKTSSESSMKEIQFNHYRKTPSPECSMKEIQFNHYRKSPSPESSTKEGHFNHYRKTPSPDNSTKEIHFNHYRKTPSPDISTKINHFNHYRKTPSPESSTKENHFNHYGKTHSLESLKEEKCFNQSKETISSKSLKKEIQSDQSTELSFSENLKEEMKFYEKQNNKEKTENGHKSKNGKSLNCNGMIPNSIYDAFPDNKTYSSQYTENKNNVKNNSKEPKKMGMSKWITMSKSEQNISTPEYSNIQTLVHKEQQSPVKLSTCDTESKDRRKKNKVKNANEKENGAVIISKVKDSPRSNMTKSENYHYNDIHEVNENTDKLNISLKSSDLQEKCKSLCDISRIDSSVNNEEIKFRKHESIADLCSFPQTQNRHHPVIEFQHFESDSEIPLCAKLVSNHEKRISRNIPSVTPSNRTESPCPSDSSHVYEDMFKETPSGPSDSEASWTVLKHNTYYVNGRSSSMNDLDFSDSCSMSVKCDYASSSESSTLQSRHSSYASSSFYVNLRDYDSHMLEPNLGKSRKNNGNTESKVKTSNASKSNPPTPESLRHLFTSPLTSIHGLPHNNSRMLNRMPSDPQSHYYSTAAATSSAFKHGFAPTAAKPKKTERTSSIKIKDIAHGIILTFKKLQNHSKNSNLPSAQHVDVSHLAELKSNSELGKGKKGQKDSKHKKNDKSHWRENGKNEFDSGFLSDVQRMKARRSSSDLTDWKSNSELFPSDKKKSKKKSGNKDKGKKSKSKDVETRTVPTVSRKVQQMADGTLYLVTTVSGDSTMPGVYSDSPDTSSELSGHRSVKTSGESNC